MYRGIYSEHLHVNKQWVIHRRRDGNVDKMRQYLKPELQYIHETTE